MENNNEKLFKIIILVIVVAVFLGVFSVFSKVFSFMKDMSKEAIGTVNQGIKAGTEVFNSDDENYIEYGNDGIDIYTIYRNIIVFAKNNRLYLANSSTGIITLNDNIFNINNLTLKNNQASFSDPFINNTIYVTDLTIDASSVYKVVATDDRETNDISSNVYILFKNGGLTKYYVGDNIELLDSNILNQYKIKNISEECVSNNDFVCEKVEYKLVLRDNSTKVLKTLK